MVAVHDQEEIRIFLDELEDGLNYLDEAIISLEENPKHQETLEEIFRVAHTIKGSAGFLDLKNLVALGHAMENVFQEFKSGTIPVTTDVISTILECKDAIGEIGQKLGKGEDTSQVKTDHLIERINSFLANTEKEAQTKAAPSAAPEKSEDLTFSTADYIPGTMLVTITISENELAPSIRAFLVNKRLSDYGEIVRQSPSEEEMEADGFVMPANRMVRYWIKTDSSKEEVEGSAQVDLVDHVGVISESLMKELSDAAHADKTEDAGRVRADIETSDSVRIPVNRLDIMLNLVGELVIANSGFLQIQETLKNLPELGDVFRNVRDRTKDLVRISGEIQELVMNSRLVPISQVFNRFKRFVRDYSTKSGKKIRLTLSGETTELDKKITDEIIKPLTHLVRNSLDHGLETPEERTASGKSETGSLNLQAYQEGNYINIIIQDDGRGINTEKILNKAIKLGIITNEEAMTMPEEEIRDLIFHSGFSTKEEIDEMSGRGVGMDVVKTSVEDLNGSLILESEIGKGTRMTIKLPLTLAILNALIVKVGSEKYCIPMTSIVETQKVSANNFLTVDSNEMVRLRERLIPVIRLDKIFPPEEGEKKEEPKPSFAALHKKENIIQEYPVIVVEYMESPIAILVDQFLSRQEVVIKSLSEHYRTIDGISGASILGDGSIILIIDVHGVIQIFKQQKSKQGIDVNIVKGIGKPSIKPLSGSKPPMAPALKNQAVPEEPKAEKEEQKPQAPPERQKKTSEVEIFGEPDEDGIEVFGEEPPEPQQKEPTPVKPAKPVQAIQKPEMDLAQISAMTPDEFEMLEDLEVEPHYKPEEAYHVEDKPLEEPEEDFHEEPSDIIEEVLDEEPIHEEPLSELAVPADLNEEPISKESIAEIRNAESRAVKTGEPAVAPGLEIKKPGSEETEEEPLEETGTFNLSEEEELQPLPPEIDIKEVDDSLMSAEKGPEEDEDKHLDSHIEPLYKDQTLQISESEDSGISHPISPIEKMPDEEVTDTGEEETSISLEETGEEILAEHLQAPFPEEFEETPETEEIESIEEAELPEETEEEIEAPIHLEDTDEELLARHTESAEGSEPEELKNIDAESFFEEENEKITETPDESELEENIEVPAGIEEEEFVSESFEFNVSDDDHVTMVSGEESPEELPGEEQRLNTQSQAGIPVEDELNDDEVNEIESEIYEMDSLEDLDQGISPEEEIMEVNENDTEEKEEKVEDNELSEFEKMKQMIESGEIEEEEDLDSIALDHFNKDDYDLTKLTNILEGTDQELVKTWLKAGNQHAIDGIKSLTGHENIYPGQIRAKKYSAEKLQSYIDRFKNDDYPVIGLTLPMLPIKGMIYFVLTHNNARNMAAMLYQTAQMPTPETIDFEPLMEVTNILGSAFTNSLTQLTDIPIEPGIPQILENNELLVEAMANQLESTSQSNILYIENEFLWGEKEVLAELVMMIPKVL